MKNQGGFTLIESAISSYACHEERNVKQLQILDYYI